MPSSTGEQGMLADDANPKRQDIAHLYPYSQQVWVESDHGMTQENREKVITATGDVLHTEEKEGIHELGPKRK